MGNQLSCIAKNTDDDKISDKKAIKLLLLGPGESGKSTIIKQMKILHSNGFTNEDINYYKPIIYSNIIVSIVAILRAMDKLSIQFKNENSEYFKSLIYDIAINRQETSPFSNQIYEALKNLWSDMGVQLCFSRSKDYQLPDSTKYYLDNLDRIVQPSWIPNNEDILRCRIRTVGLNEIRFNYRKRPFIMVDVGGQRSERPKWVYGFNSTTAVIYCVPLNCYDLVCIEDNKTNRMVETLNLWQSVVNNYWFTQCTTIIFFNKKDLFAEKINRSPFNNYFKLYDGPNNAEAIIGYIMFMFMDLIKTRSNHNDDENTKNSNSNQNEQINKTNDLNVNLSINKRNNSSNDTETINKQKYQQFDSNRTIYKHVTCATDTTNIQFVFIAITDSILNFNLKMSGLI